ncbi:glycosyltransferase family 4 protein [Haloglomus halophilum]|uniref:glycosyltransferase family 4 protein n=1 Tax=Haloglomus halophilum TaxID=2962672 RepID=UPI0020C9C319|nr:glycosyltransferase family 4 protein [Haloglomus halophilum]
MTDPDDPPSLTGSEWSRSGVPVALRGPSVGDRDRAGDDAGDAGGRASPDVDGIPLAGTPLLRDGGQRPASVPAPDGSGAVDDTPDGAAADTGDDTPDGTAGTAPAATTTADASHDDLREAVSGLRVLQLTSSRRSFFEKQVEGLEALGIECETVSVPTRDGRERGRGPREYLAFALRTLGRGLEEFDLVHANYGMLGPLALAQPTRPVVLTLWGSDLQGPGWLSRTSRLSARFADRTVVPWPSMAADLDTDHDLVPFGVDTDLFRPIPRDAARDHVGWAPDERVVLFPYAPDRPVKNHPLAERVVERVPDATLRTVSGVDYEEMPYYMAASDALLVTSDRESGPMVVREAAACNLPVVSRDVGFAADALDGVANCAIAEGEAGLAAALERVLDADGRSDGRETADELGIDETARHLARVYRSVLD